jgi:predicted dehydrogenase
VLKVAIVGCGKIADSHASQIGRIPDCEIVGVCDREPLMARQLFERFPVKRHFSDLSKLLSDTRPDVVHITTPPASHFDIAVSCLAAGANLYVEKPFTVTAAAAEELISRATSAGLKLTVGHDDQFSPAARRMRALIESGYLGGQPIHMESHFCYDIDNATYARALFGDKEHWVRKLPGRLLHNIISHGIARIAEYAGDDVADVIAHGFQSRVLEEINEPDIIDELRVILRCHSGASAYFTFSSQMRPALHQFAIYGPRNGLLLDQDHETVLKLPGKRRRSYLEKFVPPFVNAREQVGNAVTNFRAFLHNDLHPKSGMKHLTEEFYRCIVEGTPVPIAYREILLTARIMDAIFGQLNPCAINHAMAADAVLLV